MSKLEKIVEDLSGLTVLEAAELAKLLEDKWGVSAAAPVAVAAMPGAAGGAAAPAAEAQTEFNVVLEAGFDAAKKIQIIKVVREITGQGLAEAKATVEGAPKNLKEGVDKKTAEDVKKKLEEAGAKVSVKPA